MVVSKAVFDALAKQDPKVVEELTRARNLRDMSDGARKAFKNVSESRTISIGNTVLPVVELSMQSNKARLKKLREEQPAKTAAEHARNSGFVFGMNLDGSLASNLDAQVARAERMGGSRREARAKVASSVLDFHSVYRNSTDAEKALGTAREMFSAPQYQPDRHNEVVEPIHETINFGKYAKWNDKADEDARKRREIERLEEERISRDERENEMLHVM